MKIGIVHSAYRDGPSSGENVSVQVQAEMLRDAGLDVVTIAADGDVLRRQPLYNLRSAWRVATKHGRHPLAEIKANDVDLVHIHNLFPNYGSAWTKYLSVPHVVTLHNFRSLCANGLFSRENHDCFLCLEESPLAGIRNACYHNSKVRSVPLAIQSALGPQRDPLYYKASAVIALSPSAAEIFAANGFDPGTLRIIPNAISPAFESLRPTTERNSRWLYVGRIAPEKGIHKLIADWPTSYALDIVGGDFSEPFGVPRDNIRWLGRLDNDRIRESMALYEGLIFPSLCMEMQPTVVLEAWSVGLPVVALSGNAGADLVRQHGGGVVYETREGLVSALEAVRETREDLRKTALSAYQNHFSPSRWVSRILDLYQECLKPPR